MLQIRRSLTLKHNCRSRRTSILALAVDWDIFVRWGCGMYQGSASSFWGWYGIFHPSGNDCRLYVVRELSTTTGGYRKAIRNTSSCDGARCGGDFRSGTPDPG